MPCTDARRTIVDLASVARGSELESAVDRGLARRLFTVGDLFAELAFLDGRRQTGAGTLRRSLLRRHCGAPHPSVLESKALRLLAQADIHPISCEQRVELERGFYRLDFVLRPTLALEVDGYMHHFTAEAHDHDRWRHNELLFGSGWRILTYTWRQIVFEPAAVLEQVKRFIDAEPPRVG